MFERCGNEYIYAEYCDVKVHLTTALLDIQFHISIISSYKTPSMSNVLWTNKHMISSQKCALQGHSDLHLWPMVTKI